MCSPRYEILSVRLEKAKYNSSNSLNMLTTKCFDYSSKIADQLIKDLLIEISACLVRSFQWFCKFLDCKQSLFSSKNYGEERKTSVRA